MTYISDEEVLNAFYEKVPPRGLHPDAGDFDENGESEIKEFGYKRLIGDEIFTVPDWGNVLKFVIELRQSDRQYLRETIKAMRRSSQTWDAEIGAHNMALDDVLTLLTLQTT